MYVDIILTLTYWAWPVVYCMYLNLKHKSFGWLESSIKSDLGMRFTIWRPWLTILSHSRFFLLQKTVSIPWVSTKFKTLILASGSPWQKRGKSPHENNMSGANTRGALYSEILREGEGFYKNLSSQKTCVEKRGERQDLCGLVISRGFLCKVA